MCDLKGCGEESLLPPIEVTPVQRRKFLQGLASLPLATVLCYPDLASAAANTTSNVTIKLDSGTEVTAAIAMPDDVSEALCVMLIHEWWGLNDQIKSVAADLAKQGYIALAVDLYSGAEAATTPDGAKALMGKVDKAVATETLVKWVDYLRTHKNSNGKVASMGWCFGGGWSLNASIATPVDATVIYYGNVTQPAEQLKNLKGPVLGHFGKLDTFINQEMVDGFEKEMKLAEKADQLQIHWYEANHAFANPTGARYDEKNAATAWQRTIDFLAANMG
jgi:carboxymethylenebutenolidase